MIKLTGYLVEVRSEFDHARLWKASRVDLRGGLAHTYIHPSIHACMHACIPTYLHAYIHFASPW